MKKMLKLIFLMLIMSTLIVACSQKEDASEEKNPMQYVEKENLKDDIESASDGYIIIDARKTEDYSTSHIIGAYSADQHAANKEGDDATGIEHLKTALNEATGNEIGTEDSKYVLVCYSGNSYAQKATDLLIEMGVSKDNIYTLKGGMKDWDAAGDEYKALLEE